MTSDEWMSLSRRERGDKLCEYLASVTADEFLQLMRKAFYPAIDGELSEEGYHVLEAMRKME